MELSSRLSGGAANLSELMGSWCREVMVPGQDGQDVGISWCPRGTGVAPTVVDSDEETLLHIRHTVAVSQHTHGLAVADSGTRQGARLQRVRADHRRGLVVEVEPDVVDAHCNRFVGRFGRW